MLALTFIVAMALFNLPLPLERNLATPLTAYATANPEPRFRSYAEAIRHIRRTYLGERINTSRSSWITTAEYYPAEGRGYLILGMRGKDYLFAAVPLNIWDGFKNAPSLGGFYNRHIKGRYRYEL